MFFQSNKFTACKVNDEKEIVNSLITFILLNIHPFQGKKSSMSCSSLGQTFLRFKEKKTIHSYVYPFLIIFNNF